MGHFRKTIVLLSTAGLTAAADAVPSSPVELLPSLVDELYLPEENSQGDTLLIAAARAAYAMPSAARVRLMEPLLLQLLKQGYDPLHENKLGCNAVFYLAGMPEFYQRLTAENLLPRELSLRIPHEEGALLRYMRQRNNQALLSKSAGSHDYLTRRYCTPALERTQRLLQNYLGGTTVSRIPEGALGDCLTFMHLASVQAAEGFINSLTLWEHGEHFLEEIPALLLDTLHSMGWKVNPSLLRKALHKLGTLLPVSKDDMIECAASAPMSKILEMLTRLEGIGAMPELQQYAAAFDPEIVHTSLALQMKLKGIPLPWDAAYAKLTSPDLLEIREALRADAAIRRGRMDSVTGGQLVAAAAIIRKHGMPRHAEMMEGIVENEQIILRPELRPAFRTRYEELRESAPHVEMLRFIMNHEEIQKLREAQQ